MMPVRSRRAAGDTCRRFALVATVLAGTAAAQQQFAAQAKAHLPADVGEATAVAFGDVDADGELDAVVGRNGQSLLYLGDGNGAFVDATAARLPAIAATTNAVALADVDGDGDLDLVLGNAGQDRLYRNDGTGTFQDVTAATMPVDTQTANAVALGDIDGDGDLDLVVGNTGFSRLCRNDGSGRFTTVVTGSGFVITRAVVFADVDGDGDLDLLLGNGETTFLQQSQLFRNNGGGVFSDVTASNLPNALLSTAAISVADVDGDGDIDLLLGNDGVGPGASRTRLWRNNGTGTFVDVTGAQMPNDTDPTRSLALGDVDGDGDLDLVLGTSDGNLGTQARLFRNNGTGTFADATATAMPAALTLTRGVGLGDIDGDGDPDLLLANGAPLHSVGNLLYLNDGTGTFVDVAAATTTAAAPLVCSVWTDVDGDGDLDLVVGGANSTTTPGLRLLFNDGNGTLTDGTAGHMPAFASAGVTAITAGDVDGDGDVDLVFGQINSTLIFLQGKGLYLNNGSGTFADATATHLFLSGYVTAALQLVDVDGDGDLDLIAANSGSYFGSGGQSSVSLNDGAGLFHNTATQTLPGQNVTVALAVGDLDGDGDLDLVLGNNGQRTLLFRNDGAGVFTDVTMTALPTDAGSTTSLALGDVDGDGDLDLVLGRAGTTGSQSRLYRNGGNGSFADATAASLPTRIGRDASVALADLDGDGDLDLVFGTNAIESIRACTNDGAGPFTDVTASWLAQAQDGQSGVTIVDADGDGDLDLVPLASNRIHYNLLRQLSAPQLLRIGYDYPLEVHARRGPARQFDTAVVGIAPAGANLPVPPLGILRIDLQQMIQLPPMAIPATTGVASTSIAVPANPALVGITAHAQALLMQFPLQDRLTNAVVEGVQRL